MVRRLISAAAVAVVTVGVSSATATATATAASARTLVVAPPGNSCPGAIFSDVGAAIAAARRGDTVRLCPGIYPSAVVVDKAITLRGPLPTPTLASCVAAETSDPKRQAVLTGGLTLAASGVVVRGLVVDGAAVGIGTSPAYGGYRISGNLVRGSGDLGVELETNGVRATEVDHNCVRDWDGGGIVAEFGPLLNAFIYDNITYANYVGVGALGEFRHDAITIKGHQSVADHFGVVLAGTTHSSITDSGVDGRGAGGVGIQVGGGNHGLLISGNDVMASSPGIFFNRSGFGFADLRPNRHLIISNNRVHDNIGSGMSTAALASGDAGYLQNSLITHNVFQANLGSGMFVSAGSSGNVIYGNTSNTNARGIRLAAGATGNFLVANTMLNNTIIDALDENDPPANTWIHNRCQTSSPEVLCRD